MKRNRKSDKSIPLKRCAWNFEKKKKKKRNSYDFHVDPFGKEVKGDQPLFASEKIRKKISLRTVQEHLAAPASFPSALLSVYDEP